MKVATAENVTDFMTKYVNKANADASVAYLTNSANAVTA